MKRLLVVLTILSFALALFSPEITYADSEAGRQDYQVVSSDKQFVFIMLIPDVGAKAYDQINYDLRNKYPSSGLYRNDGSTQPIWTINWWAFSVYVSSDAKHIVRLGPWPTLGNYWEEALTFFENGKEIKRYLVKDLVANPAALPKSVSHYVWAVKLDLKDDVGKIYLLNQAGEKYKFEISTGNIVPNFLRFDIDIPLPFWVIIVALLIGIGGFIFDLKNNKGSTEQVIIITRK